jgi:DNA invertase Pin-like site-specific DNA recombinase
MSTRAAIYARVSTTDQHTDNQLIDLRTYVGRRGWQLAEYVDEGVSGARQARPELTRLVKAAQRRQFDVLIVWSLDRLGRDLQHLVGLLNDFHALGIGVISLREGLDWTTPSGRLQAQLLAMIAEFERARLQERIRAGLARAKAQGKRLGRPRIKPALVALVGMSVRQAAAQWGVSKSTAARWMNAGRLPSPERQFVGQTSSQHQ